MTDAFLKAILGPILLEQQDQRPTQYRQPATVMAPAVDGPPIGPEEGHENDPILDESETPI